MADGKQRAPRSDSKLLQACLDGNLAAVRERIAARANVNAGRKDHYPPLEMAARCGHLDIVRELIAAGADLNQIHKINREVFPTSALIGAISNYKYQVAEELVQAGASTALETHPGTNAASAAAFHAIEYWHLNHDTKFSALKEFAKMVIGDRPPQTFEDWFGFLKRSVASGAKVKDYCLWEACKIGCLPVFNYLISIGANVNFIANGASALQMAIKNEHDQIALALIAAKADANLRGENSYPPLKIAIMKERHTVIRALLDAGANPI